MERETSRSIIGPMAALVMLGAVHSSAAAGNEIAYPWCVQGGMLHCYDMNREQCEETVDYHGFCVTNPDYRQSSHHGDVP